MPRTRMWKGKRFTSDDMCSLTLICVLILLLTACAGASPGTPSLLPSNVPAHTPIATPSTREEDAFRRQRLKMVEMTIEARGVTDRDVLRAMQTVPRHRFVKPELLSQAYEDHPLPIGYGQTISQPYIVAWMTELLELEHGEKVLEIGTGSGYQAAVLAELGYVDVYTIEIVPELAESAKTRLIELGYEEVHVKQGDGYFGWAEYAPFDAIIVTAAPDHLPGPLAEQLAEDGRLVIPIGPPGGYQTLWKFVYEARELKAYDMGGVAFVPFTGEGIESVPTSGEPTP